MDETAIGAIIAQEKICSSEYTNLVGTHGPTHMCHFLRPASCFASCFASYLIVGKSRGAVLCFGQKSVLPHPSSRRGESVSMLLEAW